MISLETLKYSKEQIYNFIKSMDNKRSSQATEMVFRYDYPIEDFPFLDH